MNNVELQSVINAVGDLPPMPMVAVKVIQLLQDPKTDAEVLAEAISRDPAVSARILKIANSSFYSMRRQVKTLEHAIVILGEKTLRSLVLAATLKSVNRNYGLVEKMLWEDSIGCAIGARMVAARFRSADPEEAFLGGLLRHIGKLVMNNMDHQKFLLVVQESYNGEGSLEELERRYFPFSHAVIGAAVMVKWNLSENLVQVTRHHADLHLSAEEDPALYRLAATVNLADRLCRRLGVGRRSPKEEIDLSQVPGARALGLGAEALAKTEEEFSRMFEQDRTAFLT